MFRCRVPSAGGGAELVERRSVVAATRSDVAKVRANLRAAHVVEHPAVDACRAGVRRPLARDGVRRLAGLGGDTCAALHQPLLRVDREGAVRIDPALAGERPAVRPAHVRLDLRLVLLDIGMELARPGHHPLHAAVLRRRGLRAGSTARGDAQHQGDRDQRGSLHGRSIANRADEHTATLGPLVRPFLGGGLRGSQGCRMAACS